MSHSNSGWIGVDLDGTLAYYDEWRGIDHIGAPIVPMLDRVKAWVAEGKTVKIFTARVSTSKDERDPELVRKVIQLWLYSNGLPMLEVTNVKDFGMIELWDDRAVRVQANTGLRV